jgi:hypothetical protein
MKRSEVGRPHPVAWSWGVVVGRGRGDRLERSTTRRGRDSGIRESTLETLRGAGQRGGGSAPTAGRREAVSWRLTRRWMSARSRQRHAV